MTTKNNRKQKCFPILFYAVLPCFASLESIQLCSAWLRSVQLGLTWFCFALLCFALLCFALLRSVPSYFTLFRSTLSFFLVCFTLSSSSIRFSPLCSALLPSALLRSIPLRNILLCFHVFPVSLLPSTLSPFVSPCSPPSRFELQFSRDKHFFKSKIYKNQIETLSKSILHIYFIITLLFDEESP